MNNGKVLDSRRAPDAMMVSYDESVATVIIAPDGATIGETAVRERLPLKRQMGSLEVYEVTVEDARTVLTILTVLTGNHFAEEEVYLRPRESGRRNGRKATKLGSLRPLYAGVLSKQLSRRRERLLRVPRIILVSATGRIDVDGLVLLGSTGFPDALAFVVVLVVGEAGPLTVPFI